MGWVPSPHDEDHAARHADGGADELDAADLASGAATDGQVLTADGLGGAAWEAVPADALDDLSDVTITTPTLGEVLKYDGSGWVNDTDDTGSGLPAGSTKGDIAVYNGTSWVIVSAGANDTVLTADSAQSAGVKWAAASGGGGGSLGMPLPDLAGTDDDDFTDASLTAWTAIDPSGTSTKQAGSGILSVKYSGQATADLAGISKSVTLSVGDSIQTAVRLLGQFSAGNLSMAVLVMGDGNLASSNKIGFYLQLQQSGQRIFVTRGGTWEAVGSDIVLAGSPAYHALSDIGWLHMRLTYQATNSFRTEISPDGISWLAVPGSDSSRTLTPTTVGLGWTAWGASNTPIASFGYFKVNT